MSRSRATATALRLGLAVLVLLASVAPVAARSMNVTVTTSSPRMVTAGFPVAYPVSASNTGKSTLNHVRLVGNAPAAFTYLGAEPTASCSQTVPECTFGQVAAGAPLPSVIFYYRAPSTPGSYAFTTTSIVNEGTGDNSDGNSQAEDAFTSPPVVTDVVAVSTNFVSGHSIPGTRTFSTGLTNLNTTNQHGSQVVIGSNAEVTVADVPPGSITLPCPAAAPTCFGWGTSLDVAQGAPVAAGIEVTVRWDASELPNGMTAQKLRIIHLFTGGGHELVSNACAFGTNGLPTNLPCVKVAPFKFSDKDIQATILLLSNGVVRGW